MKKMHEEKWENTLLGNIVSYLEYLEKKCDFSISVHFSNAQLREIPEDVLERLLPFNVHRNLYCTVAKKQFWQTCVKRQQEILEEDSSVDSGRETDGDRGCRESADSVLCSCRECFAGVTEYIYKIRKKNQTVGFVAVSGYRGEEPPAACIDRKLWEERLKAESPPAELMDALIPPLCRMFELLFSGPMEPPAQGEYNLILHFLQECNGQVNLEDLCRHFGRSRSYLSHMFGPKHGMSLPAYCNELKLRYSRELLADTSIPVTEIALDVGYRDVSYFVSKFRDKFGITPLQYRKLRNNKMTDTDKIRLICDYFAIPGDLTQVKPLGNGHINDTLLLVLREGNQEKKYVLQKINKAIFRHPEELMENMVGVTEFLRKRIIERGGDPEREVLNVLHSPDGASFYKDEDGEYWRITKFIDRTVCFEKAEDAKSFRMTGEAYGGFQRELAEYPAKTLHETIPGFHNTRARYAQFEKAVAENRSGRADNCRKEIDFLRSRKKLAEFTMKNFENGKLPLRVTHNDTKLNNILVDEATGKALCILDLDTVMPGFSIYDFGDGIRSGACTALEDEQDLSRVHLDLGLYEAFLQGFLAGADGSLSEFEEKSIPMGALGITYEQALRFLADYIAGDPYYKTDYPEHNLVRTRTQIRMVQEMEENREKIEAILADARGMQTEK